jgi:hypothetical protein
MNEYLKRCSFCKQDIQMSDKGGRWLPYNKDGSTRDCKKEKGNDISVEVLLKKLDSIGITIDLNKVRNVR